jgi:DNA-3-methyladenine glycosylase II
MIASDQNNKKAAEYLSEKDPILSKIISASPPCTIRPHKHYYQELVSSIISQQLSIKAAATIERRFVDLFGGTFPPPEKILESEIDELRAVGFSRAKAAYVRDLAQHVADGRVKFDHLDGLSNEEVIAELTDIKGVGEWTAHMFLMFCMGRLDVLAAGDLGIRHGVQALYGLDHCPPADEVRQIAQKNSWHPYETIACWYVWHSQDNTPN